MVIGFLFRKILFWPKSDSRVLFASCSLEQLYHASFFLLTFMNSDSLMFWGCLGPNGNIHLIECKRKFIRLDTLACSKKTFSNHLLKCFIERLKGIYISDDNAFPCQSRKTKIYTKLGGIVVLQ